MTSPARGDVPVLECVQAAYRFFAANVVRLAPAALAPALAAVVSVLIGGVALPGGAAPSPLASLTGVAVSALGDVVFLGAVLRLAIRNEYVQPAGVTFAADELRLLGVGLLLSLAIGPFIILGVLVLSIVVLGRLAQSPDELERIMGDPKALADAMTQSLGSTGVMLLGFGMLAFALALCWVAIRLCLANAATVGERRVVIFQTWGWTKGNLLRVLAAAILTYAPMALALWVISSILDFAIFGGDPQRFVELPRAVQAASVGLNSYLAAILGVPIPALLAQLYKGLRPPDFVAK